MLQDEKSNSTMAMSVDMVAPMSPVGSTSKAAATAPTTTTKTTTLIQQQPPCKPRRVRDELDPAPHHTASDIRVLEILKRIRDSGGVCDDDDLAVPQPKRKSGRTKTNRTSYTRQTPTPVLPQPRPTPIASTAMPAAKLPIDHFKVPSYSLSDGVRARSTAAVTIPVRLKNGAIVPPSPPSPAILLPAKNNTAGLVVTCTDAVDVKATTAAAAATVRQKPLMTGTQATQQTAIGLELILPNGLRIPVSATCAKPELKMHSAAVTIGSAATNGLSSTMPLLEAPTTTATTNASQQICSCSRSKCLKLYCDCFAAGKACSDGCNCRHCYNNLADDVTKHTRDVAVRTALSRNPLAFKPKIENTGKHVLGCRCKRSHCLKGYCECYLAKIPCNQRCRCLGCSNDEATGTDAIETMAADIACTSAAPDATSITVTVSKPIDEVHMSLLASLTAGSGSTTTATPSIALKVPIKAPTPVNGTDRMAHPPLLIHPSYLATAATVAARGTNSVHQDLLECLRTIHPPTQLQFPPQSQTPNFIIPGVFPMTMMTDGLANASMPETAALISKLSPPLSAMIKAELTEEEQMDCVSNDATALTSEPSPPGEFINDSGDQQDVGISDNEEEGMIKEEDYSGYTEEELAFMQRLQQDRKAVVAPAPDVPQQTRRACHASPNR